MKFMDVLVTCPDRTTAEQIAMACVERRLAACANIGNAINSIYRWQGAIETADEIALTLKTRASLFDRLSAQVKALHPYQTPCIIAMELSALDPAYAAWLEAETA